MDTDYFEFLKSCFDEWNTKNPEKNTIRGLARLTGIGKNVVYNMANGIPRQSKYGYQDVSQYLKMTQVEKNLYLEFIKTHYQDFINFAEQFIVDRESVQDSKEKLIEILRSPIGCEIFQACITKRGMRRSEIQERFGIEGIKILNIFIRNEILKDQNGWIKHAHAEHVTFDSALSNLLIRNNVANLDFNKFDEATSRQWIVIRSISKEIFEEVKNIGNETFEKLYKLTLVESSANDAVIIKIGFVMDSDQMN